MPNNIIPFILILTIIFLTLSSQTQTEKSPKQTKADACIKIVQSRIKQDSESYKNLISMLKESSTNEGEDNAINKLVSISILSCYKDIPFFDADEIYHSSHEIDSMTWENKKLLSWEKWTEAFSSGNKEVIEYELSELNEAVSDIKSGDIDLSAITKPPSKKKMEDLQGTNTEQYDEDLDSIYWNQRDGDFTIFGYSWNKIDKNYKNVIGITLIFLLFVFVIVGLKWINNIRNEGKKDKKKKKKKMINK